MLCSPVIAHNSVGRDLRKVWLGSAGSASLQRASQGLHSSEISCGLKDLLLTSLASQCHLLVGVLSSSSQGCVRVLLVEWQLASATRAGTRVRELSHLEALTLSIVQVQGQHLRLKFSLNVVS